MKLLLAFKLIGASLAGIGASLAGRSSEYYGHSTVVTDIDRFLNDEAFRNTLIWNNRLIFQLDQTYTDKFLSKPDMLDQFIQGKNQIYAHANFGYLDNQDFQILRQVGRVDFVLNNPSSIDAIAQFSNLGQVFLENKTTEEFCKNSEFRRKVKKFKGKLHYSLVLEGPRDYLKYMDLFTCLEVSGFEYGLSVQLRQKQSIIPYLKFDANLEFCKYIRYISELQISSSHDQTFSTKPLISLNRLKHLYLNNFHQVTDIPSAVTHLSIFNSSLAFSDMAISLWSSGPASTHLLLSLIIIILLFKLYKINAWKFSVRILFFSKYILAYSSTEFSITLSSEYK